MPKAKLWNNSVPRVELDQRARAARLRLERVERLLAPRLPERASWLRRLLCRFGLGAFRGRSPGDRTARLPNDRRPSRLPQIPRFSQAISVPLRLASRSGERGKMQQRAKRARMFRPSRRSAVRLCPAGARSRRREPRRPPPPGRPSCHISPRCGSGPAVTQGSRCRWPAWAWRAVQPFRGEPAPFVEFLPHEVTPPIVRPLARRRNWMSPLFAVSGRTVPRPLGALDWPAREDRGTARPS